MYKHWKNRDRVLVVGLGYRTGIATANFLAKEGRKVTVSDIKSREELKSIIDNLDPSVKVLGGIQDISILDAGFDLIVLSPGVPQSIALIQEGHARGIPVISEIELAYPYIKGTIVGITGTDGKSTTTSLVAHILSELKFKTVVGGNIGVPLISLVSETTDESVTIIELSSFQLETINSFKPHVSAILNISTDHLDRYNGMEDYFLAKKNIFKNQTSEDYCILNTDDPIIKNDTGVVDSQCLFFSMANKESQAWSNGEELFLNINRDNISVMNKDDLKIIGVHNIQNALAAFLMVWSCLTLVGRELDIPKLAKAASSFPGLEHRMEPAGVYSQREFVNDSKATTVHAVEMAAQSVNGNAVFIVGGRTKGDEYFRLSSVMQGRVRGVVLIGESQEEFSEIFKEFNVLCADDMTDAVIKAMKLSKEGDRIILSPACASFDMYTSYEERGRIFKEAVTRLRKGELVWT